MVRSYRGLSVCRNPRQSVSPSPHTAGDSRVLFTRDRGRSGRGQTSWLAVGSSYPRHTHERGSVRRFASVCLGWRLLAESLFVQQRRRWIEAKRTGPRAVAPILLPESDSPASRQGNGVGERPRTRPRATARSGPPTFRLRSCCLRKANDREAARQLRYSSIRSSSVSPGYPKSTHE